MSYELSIWDHKDNFIHLLKSEYPFEGSAFNAIFTDRVNGNGELSFSIPMYVFDNALVELDFPSFFIEESGDLSLENENQTKAIFSINDLNANLRHTIENPPLNEIYTMNSEGEVEVDLIDDVALKINPLWLYIKNEYKVRLTRFKGTNEEEIHDFVIKNFSENRTYDSRTIDVVCKNYAIHELSKIGYSIILNEETPLKTPPENGKINIDYWMEIILAYTRNKHSGGNPSGWTFEVEAGVLNDSIVPGYNKTGESYSPKQEIIREKERIIKLEKSNVFNAIQELCEKFEVWAHFLYTYDSYGKIIGRKVLLKSEIEKDSVYSISYGINAGDMSKESNSDELVTKIIVENVESDLENSGVMSFSDAPQNLMMENFIYNFDYYQQAGFISEEKNNWVKTDFAYSVRNKNVAILEQQSQLNKLQLDYDKAAADLEFVTYEIAAAKETIQDAQSKASQYSMQTVSGAVLTYSVVDRGSYKYVNLSGKKGVLSSPAPVVRTTAGTIVPTVSRDYDPHNPSYIVGLRLGTSAPTTVKITFSYNSYNYYQSLLKIETNKLISLNLKKSNLEASVARLTSQINNIQENIQVLLVEKQNIINAFEEEYYEIIKEGSWKDDGYRLRVQSNSISNFSLSNTQISKATQSYVITTDLNNVDFSTLQCFKTDRSFTYYDKADFTLEYGIVGTTLRLLLCPTESGAFNVQRLQSGGSSLFVDNSSVIVAYKTISGVEYVRTINRSTTAKKLNREYYISAPNVLTSTIKIIPQSGDEALVSPEDFIATVEYDRIKITFNTTEKAKHLSKYSLLEYDTNITSQFFYNDALSVAERSAFPEVSYSIAAVDLSTLEGFEGFSPKVGQKILINDRELWLINQYGFLSEIAYNLDNPSETQLTISNYKTKFEDLFQRIVASTQQLNLRSESIDRLLQSIPPTGIINPGVLQKSVEQNSLILKNSINNEVVWDNLGITLTDKSETNKTPGQVRIVGGGIFLSNSVDDSGERVWRTGITPEGLNATEITTGSLNTGRITIWDESNPRFLWNSEGLFAYALSSNYETNFNQFIKFNSDGIVSYSNYSTGTKTFEIKSDGSAYFSGTLSIKSGSSGIGNLSDAGSLATKDNVGVNDLNSTVISGGYIATNLLTANNIVTGTLKSQNNHSWINLNDGKFSFGNGALTFDGSNAVFQGKVTINSATTFASGYDPTTKSTTFRQSTTPTAKGVGDLWIHTGQGNKVYRWSGASWVASPLEAAALGTTIISGGKIVTSLLTASNIVTGTLNANLVNIISNNGTSRLELVGTGLNGYLNNILRVQVEYDRLEFHRAGSAVGNIRSEYVNQVWQGATIGDCLFIESTGNHIVFNAASGKTAPSMIVAPTWVDIPRLTSESISIGVSDPQKWTIKTESSDALFSIEHVLGKKLSYSSTGTLTLTNGSFSRLTSWANQLNGKPYSWHIHLDGTNAILGYTDSAGTRSIYTLTHAHPYAPSSHSHAWSAITGKPTTFAPSSHSHAWSAITGKPTTFAPSSHSHSYLPLSGGTLTGQLNMGSNNIVGSTTDCWITARRMGLGVAANNTYTLDAGTTGHIRCGTLYTNDPIRMGASIGKDTNLRIYTGGQYNTYVFVGGVLVGVYYNT